MWRIEVNELPPTSNKIWAGVHWAKRKQIADTWHVLFYDALRTVDIPRPLPNRGEPYQIHCTLFCKRRRDADNGWVGLKLFQDTLVKYGYLPDDNSDYINDCILTSKKGNNKIVINIL